MVPRYLPLGLAGKAMVNGEVLGKGSELRVRVTFIGAKASKPAHRMAAALDGTIEKMKDGYHLRTRFVVTLPPSDATVEALKYAEARWRRNA